MSIVSDGDLMDLRGIALSMMVDSCVIERPTGTYETDQNTGAATETRDPVWSGPCKVILASGAGTDVHNAEQPSVQSQPQVVVPYDSTPAQAGDLLTVTSTDEALDGRTFRVESFYGQTWSVERRYVCEESTTPDIPA